MQSPFLKKDDGIDAEQLSQLVLFALGQASINRNLPVVSGLLSKIYHDLQLNDSRLEQKLFGTLFKNPVGLAAGFDKNGIAATIWDHFGFGFAELPADRQKYRQAVAWNQMHRPFCTACRTKCFEQ